MAPPPPDAPPHEQEYSTRKETCELVRIFSSKAPPPEFKKVEKHTRCFLQLHDRLSSQQHARCFVLPEDLPEAFPTRQERVKTAPLIPDFSPLSFFPDRIHDSSVERSVERVTFGLVLYDALGVRRGSGAFKHHHCGAQYLRIVELDLDEQGKLLSSTGIDTGNSTPREFERELENSSEIDPINPVVKAMGLMDEVCQSGAGDGTEAFRWLGITLASHFKKLVGNLAFHCRLLTKNFLDRT